MEKFISWLLYGTSFAMALHLAAIICAPIGQVIEAYAKTIH